MQIQCHVMDCHATPGLLCHQQYIEKEFIFDGICICLQGAVDEGYFKQQPWKGAGQARAEVNLHAMTAGVAMLSLYCWLISLKQQVDQFGSSSLPAVLAIVTDKVCGIPF